MIHRGNNGEFYNHVVAKTADFNEKTQHESLIDIMVDVIIIKPKNNQHTSRDRNECTSSLIPTSKRSQVRSGSRRNALSKLSHYISAGEKSRNSHVIEHLHPANG